MTNHHVLQHPHHNNATSHHHGQSLHSMSGVGLSALAASHLTNGARDNRGKKTIKNLRNPHSIQGRGGSHNNNQPNSGHGTNSGANGSSIGSSSDNNTLQRIMLSDVVYLYSKRGDDPFMVSYEVECTTLKTLEVTLNFKDSENFKAVPDESIVKANTNALALSATVPPFHRQALGRVIMIDDEKRATLRMSVQWKLVDADDKEVDDYMHLYRLRIMQTIDEAEKRHFPSLLEDPDNSRCAEIHAKTGVKFVDREFPPNDSSLYPKLLTKDGRTLMTVSGKVFQKSTKHIEFKRPEQFMNAPIAGNAVSVKSFANKLNGSPIQVFCDDICPDDIRQGALGDCWFLSALAAMTEFPDLIYDLFAEHCRDIVPCGAYNIRFCKNGMWTMVRVDDYFPCYPNAGPIYSRNNDNELWVLLIEKAFAKLHGCYAAIRSGYVHEALMDLTGAPCVTFKLEDEIIQKKVYFPTYLPIIYPLTFILYRYYQVNFGRI